jgi:hypothetical protein
MALAGAWFGLLHLARPEGTFVYLAAPAALLIFGVRRVHRPLPKLAAYAIPGLIALVAGMAITHASSGAWSVNYRVAFIGDQPEGSTLLRDFARTLVGMSADVPAVMLGPLLWAFFGIGVSLPGSHKRDVPRELSVLYFALAQWLIVLPVLSPSPRYLMSAFVVCAIWSARGIEQSTIMLSRVAPRVSHAPLVVVVAWMLFHGAAQVASERLAIGSTRPVQPWEYKLAGEWMRQHVEPGVIMTRKPQIGFYAGMRTIGPAADNSLDDILATAASGSFRYLAVDERYTAQLVPALKPLLDPAAAPSGLRLVSDDASPYAGARVVIYEFVSSGTSAPVSHN